MNKSREKESSKGKVAERISEVRGSSSLVASFDALKLLRVAPLLNCLPAPDQLQRNFFSSSGALSSSILLFILFSLLQVSPPGLNPISPSLSSYLVPLLPRKRVIIVFGSVSRCSSLNVWYSRV